MIILSGIFFEEKWFWRHEDWFEIYAFPSSEDGLLARPFIILMLAQRQSFEPFTTRVFPSACRPSAAGESSFMYSSQFSFKMNSSSRNHARIQKFTRKFFWPLTFELQKGGIHLLTLSGLQSDFNASQTFKKPHFTFERAKRASISKFFKSSKK